MANFFSRPDLSDVQFKQLGSSELHLSGTTHFMKIDGLRIADGSGNTVPIIATGATSGHVLTYIDGNITLQPAGATSDTLFPQGLNDITRTPYGGLNVSASTVTTFLEGFFFPSVPPTSSLGASNSAREFGDSVGGSLSYSIVKNTNQLCAASIDTTGDGGLNCPIITGIVPGSCSGSEPYSFPGNCPGTVSGLTQTSVGYSMCASTTANEVTLSSAGISWKNRRYYFQTTTLYAAADASTLQTIAQGLTGVQAVLSTSITSPASNYVLTLNNQFFYYMYPSTFGTPSFVINGLPNTAWGNAGTGTLFKIDYTNNNGYLNQYYVARSDSRITGTFTIAIT